MSPSEIRPSRKYRNAVATAPAVRVSPALALAIAAGAILLPAGAQETTSTTATNRIPEVVVTATRSATAPENTAASVTIIGRDEIEARKITTLADALQGIPSMSLVRNGTPGQATSVFTRGTESNHTLLMIDGRRIPANLAGGYDYANLSLDNIDRIEVVRTGSSSLYGGDAIGGVINLITRTGRGMEKPETEFSFEGGSFNTFRESAASRGASGKFDYSVSASQLNANFPRNNNQYRNSSIRSSFGYELNEAVYFDLKASYYQSDGG
ncbi:MAG TPA: TonB-dependent receptor plug domain-containing protein, partial [Roseimicrobium sp.]|nr:TonB-dependent receptor plug domain-containing protein [Roseimicrobium sp.]